MLLQQQMEMIQAAEALKEAWNVVDGMLKTFSREAGIHLVCTLSHIRVH